MYIIINMGAFSLSISLSTYLSHTFSAVDLSLDNSRLTITRAVRGRFLKPLFSMLITQMYQHHIALGNKIQSSGNG